MRWKRHANYIESDCGRFTVTRYSTVDTRIAVGPWKYEAWRRGKPMATWLGRFDSSDEAKAYVADYIKTEGVSNAA